jgi:hypothetical protein
MLDGEVVIYGVFVPLVARRKIPMNGEDARSVYKNFTIKHLELESQEYVPCPRMIS